MATATSAFMVERRELEFVLFEHLGIQSLFSYPFFADHSIETIGDMISSGIDMCQQVTGPLNKSGDREGCHHDKVTKKVTTPRGTKEAYQKYVESGFLTLADSVEAGGLQAPSSVAALFIDIFSGANQSFMMYGGLTKSASHVFWHFGTPWMREVCVPKMAQGQWTGTMCLTEPAVGSAVGDLRTSAKPMPDGSYCIKGVKQWISGGENDFTENILHLVLARIEGAPQGIEGVSLFLVPKKRFDKKTGQITGDNDVYCISIEEKMGLHGNSTCLMSFGERDGCEGYLIGEANQGISYMFLMMNEARIGVALQGVAQGSVAFLNAENYAKERIQGVDVTIKRGPVAPPRVSIVNHPDVRRSLLRQRSIVEGGRALCYLASHIYDLSVHSKDEEDRKKYHGFLELLTPIAKAWNTDMGFGVIVSALQVYGGYGYTKDYPIEQLLRDCKIASIYEGTNGIQALDFVGRKMRMQEGAVFMGWLERHTDFIEAQREHAVIGTECQTLEEYVGLLVEGAMSMAELGKAGERRAAITNAYPYLMAFGHITIAGLLLEQAHIAAQKLESKSLPADEKRFYSNKVKTAKFFVHHVLPEARAYLANVTSADRSCLDFEF